MPITILSKLFEKPSSPTNGDLWWAAMERNIQYMNDHTHNGTNSQLIAGNTQAVSGAAWGADLGGGSYRQTITVPSGINFDNNRIEVRTSDGQMVYPTIVKVSTTTFYIYTNNNSQGYTISYV
jgi:hypothetical protein